MDSDSVNLPEGYSVVDHSNVPEGYNLVQPPSMLESAGRGALNNFPMAKQAAAAIAPINPLSNKANYSDELADLTQSAAISKAVNPYSYKTGSVVGAVAPAFIPGIGQALKAAPVLGNAALGAANAVSDTDLLQNPQQALKQGLAGSVMGGALGKILPTGQAAEEGLKSLSNRKLVESMGFPTELLDKPKSEIEAFGQTLHDLGLDKGSIDDKVNLATQHLQAVGQQIGTKGLNAAPLEDVTPYVKRLDDLMKESSSIYEPGQNAEMGAYRQAIANLQDPAGMTFDKLQNLKSSVGSRAFDATHGVKNDALANVYGVYKDAMGSIVDNSGEYKDLMRRYSDLLDINNALSKMRGRINAGGVPAKGYGMFGKLGSLVTGGNVPATVGLGAALAPTHPFGAIGVLSGLATNPGAVSTGARAIAPLAGKAVQGGNQALIDYLTSKYGANNANQQ